MGVTTLAQAMAIMSNDLMIFLVIGIGLIIAITVLRGFISDKDIKEKLGSLEETEKDLERINKEMLTRTKIISGKWATRNAPKKRAREIFDGSKYIERPTTNEEVIDDGEMHQCPNCEVSIMIHWEKCYHCGYRIQS